MSELLYLDHAASTPLRREVIESMVEVQKSGAWNPASNHAAGWQSAARVGEAAESLGGLLNCDPAALLWTSGATEANNLAIRGIAEQRAHRGRHLVSARTEHKSVVDVFQFLEKKQGFEVTWLSPGADGRIGADQVAGAIRADTQLVSIMHVNNETGAINPIAEIGAHCRARGVPFHVDGAQAAGKLAVDLADWPVDLYSLTAHKFYGPRGVGALFVAPAVVLQPLFFGGGQQRRLRPGTVPVDLVAGMGVAARLAACEWQDEWHRCRSLGERLWRGIRDVAGIVRNCGPENAVPGILNVSVDDVEGESLLLAMTPCCVAAGSACNALSGEPSYVLRALGRSDRQAQAAIRFSLGRGTSADDVDRAAGLYRDAVSRLRAMAPVSSGKPVC